MSSSEIPGNFSRALRHLRLYEEVVLYDAVPDISQQDKEQAVRFLQEEYQRESREYPSGVPPFHPQAALWAARVIYHGSQLLLFRQHNEELLTKLFADFEGVRTPDVILSADLTLRFLPSLLQELHTIDPEDILLPVLRTFAAGWDYSSIGSNVPSEGRDFIIAQQHPLLLKLYIDRVILLRDKQVAAIPGVNKEIRTALGLYSRDFWQDFDLIKTIAQ